jgi:hypothetical protein
MDRLELDLHPSPPAGGAAQSGGGFFHASFRSGSRAQGASARAAYDYIEREDAYSGPERDPVVYEESGHMPDWAEDDPGEYWEAADLFERANGRLYVAGDFALPNELSTTDQIALARDFARAMTDEERLPYTLAIHEGRDAHGEPHNPHVHLMFSERQNDGLARSREDWFSRANREQPELGGAPKSRTFHGPAWVERARATWADRTNQALERAGHETRVDHRSYERQGVDREPGEHYGPRAAGMAARGRTADRLEDVATARDDERRLQDLEREIERLAHTRDDLLAHGLPEDRPPERRDYSHSFGGGGRSDGSSWER